MIILSSWTHQLLVRMYSLRNMANSFYFFHLLPLWIEYRALALKIFHIKPDYSWERMSKGNHIWLKSIYCDPGPAPFIIWGCPWMSSFIFFLSLYTVIYWHWPVSDLQQLLKGSLYLTLRKKKPGSITKTHCFPTALLDPNRFCWPLTLSYVSYL